MRGSSYTCRFAVFALVVLLLNVVTVHAWIFGGDDDDDLCGSSGEIAMRCEDADTPMTTKERQECSIRVIRCTKADDSSSTAAVEAAWIKLCSILPVANSKKVKRAAPVTVSEDVVVHDDVTCYSAFVSTPAGKKSFEGWRKLGQALMGGSTTTATITGFDSAKQVTAKDCFEHSIEINPKQGELYVWMATQQGDRQTQKATLLKAVEHGPRNPDAWYNIALVLGTPNAEVQLLNGNTITAKDCALKAVELNGEQAAYWMLLGAMMAPDEMLKVSAGTSAERDISSRDCFLDAVAVSKGRNAQAWLTLGNSLAAGDSTNLRRHVFGRSSASQLECYLLAIAQDPNFAAAWYNVGIAIEPPNQVALLDKVRGKPTDKKVTQQDCMLKTLDLDPTHGRAYYALGVGIGGGSVRLLNGTVMYAQQFAMAAINYAPEAPEVWAFLGVAMPETHNAELMNGTVMSRRQILAASMHMAGYDESSPFYEISFKHLCNSINTKKDSYTLMNGKTVTDRDCQNA